MSSPITFTYCSKWNHAAPRGEASRNYLEWRFDTKELFRVAVKFFTATLNNSLVFSLSVTQHYHCLFCCKVSYRSMGTTGDPVGQRETVAIAITNGPVWMCERVA